MPFDGINDYLKLYLLSIHEKILFFYENSKILPESSFFPDAPFSIFSIDYLINNFIDCREKVDLLSYENNFSSEHFNSSSLFRLHWALTATVTDNWNLFTLVDGYEEVQNAGLFSSLNSILGMLFCGYEKEPGISLYSADCKSEGTESRLGADFGIIIPVSDTTYKVALFQAKKADSLTQTSIYRQSPSTSDYQQVTRLIDSEREFLELYDIKSKNFRYYKNLLNHLSYYVFWHNPETQTLPTILSAYQAARQVWTRNDMDFSIYQTPPIIPTPAKMNIDPIKGGTWFAEAVSLLLPRRDNYFGLELNQTEISSLLASPYRPKSLISVQMPGPDLRLQPWQTFIPPELVENTREARFGSGGYDFDQTLKP